MKGVGDIRVGLGTAVVGGLPTACGHGDEFPFAVFDVFLGVSGRLLGDYIQMEPIVRPGTKLQGAKLCKTLHCC